MVEIAGVTDVGPPPCVNTYTIESDQPMVFVVYELLCPLRDHIEGGLDNFNIIEQGKLSEENEVIIRELMLPHDELVQEEERKLTYLLNAEVSERQRRGDIQADN